MICFMRGTYVKDGKEHLQVGIINIIHNSVRGVIMDPSSDRLREGISGKLEKKGDEIILTFKKNPGSLPDAQVCYELKKIDGGCNIEGTYEGYWMVIGEDEKFLGRDQTRMTLDSHV